MQAHPDESHIDGVDPALAADWDRRLRAILDLPHPGRVTLVNGELVVEGGKPRLLLPTPGAEAVTAEFCARGASCEDGDGWTAKTTRLRLVYQIAGLLALLGDANVPAIPADCAVAAIAWHRYLTPRYINYQSQLARHIADWFRMEKRTSFSLRDAINVMSIHDPGEEDGGLLRLLLVVKITPVDIVADALSNLARRNWVRCVPAPDCSGEMSFITINLRGWEYSTFIVIPQRLYEVNPQAWFPEEEERHGNSSN